MKDKKTTTEKWWVDHSLDLEKKLKASEAEVARLKEALKHVAGEALDSYRRVALLGEEVNKLRGKPESVKPYEQYRHEQALKK
jgi:hypothetical protein